MWVKKIGNIGKVRQTSPHHGAWRTLPHPGEGPGAVCRGIPRHSTPIPIYEGEKARPVPFASGVWRSCR
jgi:hypothetical protein